MIESYLLNYLTDRISKAFVQIPGSTILLADVLKALELTDEKIYGMESELCQIRNRWFHPIEILTTDAANIFIHPDDRHIREEMDDQTEDSFYRKTNLVENYEKFVEQNEEKEEEEFLCTNFDASDDEEEDEDDEEEEEKNETKEHEITSGEKVKSEIIQQLEIAQVLLDSFCENIEEEKHLFLLQNTQESNKPGMNIISVWDQITLENSDIDYYELKDGLEEEALTQIQQIEMLTNDEFQGLLGLTVSTVSPYISLSEPARIALRLTTETALFKALSSDSLGWQISKQATEWRYKYAISEHQELQMVNETNLLANQNLQAQNDALKKEIEYLQVQIRASEKEKDLSAPNVSSSSSTDNKENVDKPSLTRLSKLKRTLTNVGSRKKAKVNPL